MALFTKIILPPFLAVHLNEYNTKTLLSRKRCEIEKFWLGLKKMATISHLLCQIGVGAYQKALISPLLLILGVWNEKTTSWKSCSANLLTPASRSCRVIKGTYISLIIGSTTSKYENSL